MYIKFAFVFFFAALETFAASAADFKGPQICSNLKQHDSPYTPDDVLLIPYVDRRGRTAWLYTTGRHTSPLFGRDDYNFAELEQFDIQKMESFDSTASAEEWEENVFAFRLPEYDNSVVTHFECEGRASRADLSESFGSWIPNGPERIAELLEKVSEYGSEPKVKP